MEGEERLVVDEDGECWLVSRLFIFWIRSSSLVAMKVWVAVRLSWVEVSLAMASSMWSKLDLECVESAMELNKSTKMLGFVK